MRMTVTALLLLFGVATIGRAEPLLQETFDQGTGGWQALTPDTAVGPVTTATADAHQGGALVCHYSLKGGGVYLVGCPVGRKLTGARSVRLWLRTEQDAVLAIGLQEADQSRYATVVRSAAGVWQDVQVSLQRMRLAPDTTDENGKLDLNQVDGVGVIDISAFVAPLTGWDTQAERTLQLDDFRIVAEDSADAYTLDGHLPYLLDTFEAGCATWLPALGTVNHNKDAHALVWSYPHQQPQGRFTALMGFIGPLPKEGATHLLLTLKSKRAATLAVVLQEEARPPNLDESRYTALLEVPASETATTYAVPLDELQLDTNNGGKDENGHLDLDQVAVLLLGDIGVFTGAETQDNELQLEEIELIGAG